MAAGAVRVRGLRELSRDFKRMSKDLSDDLTELGGFDDSLEEPAYYSDNLLCLEARAAGMVLRDVRVGLRHLESVTSEPTNNLLVQRASAANRARYVTRVRELTAAPAQRVVV